MKFKSDKHRKAVFANMFGNGSSPQTKVNSSHVKNFEVKGSKMKTQSYKASNFRSKPVKLKDIKVKPSKEFCNMCKEKGLSLEEGRCKRCSEEIKGFDPNKKPIRAHNHDYYTVSDLPKVTVSNLHNTRVKFHRKSPDWDEVDNDIHFASEIADDGYNPCDIRHYEFGEFYEQEPFNPISRFDYDRDPDGLFTIKLRGKLYLADTSGADYLRYVTRYEDDVC